MAQGYEKFKTPIYEVYVGDKNSTPDKMIKLPYQVYRLIEKIEILRTFDYCFINDTITITFAEGSREPFPQTDNVDTKSLYPLESGSKDALSNRPGLLPDLHFSQSGTGITSLIDSVGAALGGASQLVSTVGASLPISGSAFTGTLDIDKPSENLNLQYLFQEGNRVRVDWGYLEDFKQGIKRSAVSRIMVLQTDFPENGIPTTTIVCQSQESIFDKISTPLGVKFAHAIPSGVDTNTGTLLLRYDDIPTKELIETICAGAGIKTIISSDLDADTINKDNVKKWIAGESLYQFLKNLADRHNCFFSIYIDPTDGKDTLAFIKRSEFEKTSSIDDKSLFVYKGAGSIIKSLGIKVDFGAVMGNAKVGYGRDGQLAGVVTEGSKEVVLFKGEKLQAQNPGSIDASAQKISSSLARGGTSTGKVEVHPEADNKLSLQRLSTSQAHCQAKIVMMDFVTLGHIQIDAGQTIHFQNIGDRYTGRYNVISVVHALEPNSYICRGTAKSASLGGGVGVDSKFIPGEDKDFLVNTQLFDKAPKLLSNPSTSLMGGGSVKGQYDKSR